MPAEDVELTGSFVKNSYPYSVTYHYEDAKGNEIYADDSVKNVSAEFESVIPYNTTSPKKYAIDGKDANFVLDKVVIWKYAGRRQNSNCDGCCNKEYMLMFIMHWMNSVPIRKIQPIRISRMELQINTR